MSRTDDVINTAGHRLSTAQIEEVLLSHQKLAEVAVIAAYDDLKGEVPVGVVVVKKGAEFTASTLVKELIALVRTEIGPVASFHCCLIVQNLPKTRSGKLLRGTMKKMLNGMDYGVPATIMDCEVLPILLEEMRIGGFALKKKIEFEQEDEVNAKKKVLLLCGDYAEDYDCFGPYQMSKMLGHKVHKVSPGRRTGDFVKTVVHDLDEASHSYSEKPGHNFMMNFNWEDIDEDFLK